MHEMSICEGIIQTLREQAAIHDYKKVEKVCLEIGALAGVEIGSLRLCFEAATRGTLAQGAELEIVETDGLAWCMVCAKSVKVKKRFDVCPHCGGYQLQVTGGDELRIKELEVD